MREVAGGLHAPHDKLSHDLMLRNNCSQGHQTAECKVKCVYHQHRHIQVLMIHALDFASAACLPVVHSSGDATINRMQECLHY